MMYLSKIPQWVTLVLLLLFANNILSGQANYLKADLLDDLEYLNTIYKEVHPANFQNPQPVKLDGLINRTREELPAQITSSQYEQAIRQALSVIGCVHTSIRKNPLVARKRTKSRLPVFFELNDRGMFIRSEPKNKNKFQYRPGDQLLKLDSIDSQQLQSTFNNYFGSDGGTPNLSRDLFATSSSYLLGRFFLTDTCTTLRVQKETGSILNEVICNQDSTKTPRWFPKHNFEVNLDLKYGDFSYTDSTKQIGWLYLKSFKRKDSKYIKRIIRQLNANQSKLLVIDLRENLGGSLEMGMKLLRYLLPEEFSYTKIKPKENVYQFASSKFTRFWSFLNYEVFQMFYRKKSKDGVLFEYRFKPKKEQFKGQVVILTSGYTASTASMVAAFLRHKGNAVIAGTPTGGGTTTNNGGSYPSVTLPKSEIKLRMPVFQLNYQLDVPTQREGLVPDLLLEPKGQHLQAEKALNRILAFLEGTAKPLK